MGTAIFPLCIRDTCLEKKKKDFSVSAVVVSLGSQIVLWLTLFFWLGKKKPATVVFFFWFFCFVSFLVTFGLVSGE